MLIPTRARTCAIAVLALAALAGCASPPVGGTAAATASATTSAGATPAPATATPSTTSGSGPVVDLVLSGWKAITAKGSAGTCQLATNGGTPVAFGFSATDADYPGLGTGLYINGTASSVSIKWYAPDNQGFVSGPTDVLGTVSPDNRSVTLDGDLMGSPGSEHFEGTISCP